MAIQIVIGLGFGDEGKGLATDWCCRQSPTTPLVVRFNGGQQAGHTVLTADGKRHVFSSFGAGTLSGAPSYWARFCTVAPGPLLREYTALRALGVQPQLYLDRRCAVTTHYDVFYNRALEMSRGGARHGSCGLGFGATVQRQEETPFKLYAQDLAFPDIMLLKLKQIRGYYQEKTKELANVSFDEFDHDAEDQRMMEYLHQLAKLMAAGALMIRSEADMFSNRNPWEHYVFEGAQGLLLDMDYGFFPNVTRSNTGSRNALALLRAHLPARMHEVNIRYVTRAYLTRHGAGPLPLEHDLPALRNNEQETNRFNDHQGNFRTAPLNADLLRFAFQSDDSDAAGFNKSLLISCLDQINDARIPIWDQGIMSERRYTEIPGICGVAFNDCAGSWGACGENDVKPILLQ